MNKSVVTAIPTARPAEHLVDIILNRNDNTPSYALFLGAGASCMSGIKTADNLVEDWRRQLYESSKTHLKYGNWLTKQVWYGSDEEYGMLFEQIYDMPAQRRDFIETCLVKGHPTWGYVYLSNLLGAQIFNTVFTTNFDDLINESCYLYSENVRPMVCAHDSEVSNVSITRKRVKIIKLHGDFLYDSIKNTPEETKRRETNMEAKLTEFGREFGLVIVGYGGRDNSIMSVLEKLTAKSEYYKHGIYWCIQKGGTLKPRVQKLMNRKKVHLIEISGFDELMAFIHRKAKIPLPSALINPMEVAEQRSKVFCSVQATLLEDDIIRKDSEKVLDGLGKLPSKRTKGKYKPPEELPLEVKVAIMKRKGDLPAALEYSRLALMAHKNDPNYSTEFADLLVSLGRIEELRTFIKTSKVLKADKTYYLLFTNDDGKLVDLATRVLNKMPIDFIARINRAIAYKRLGKTREMNADLKAIEDLRPYEAVAAGVAALRKKKPQMFKLLNAALNKKQLSLDDLVLYPVFEDYRPDAEFQKFVTERRGRRSAIRL